MRFAVASAALLVPACASSIDAKRVNKLTAVNRQSSPRQQLGNHKEIHRRQLRRQKIKRLLHQLASKKKEQSVELRGSSLDEPKASHYTTDTNVAVPDLGVIGKRKRERRLRTFGTINNRIAKESIINKDPVRQRSGDDKDDIQSESTHNYTSSVSNAERVSNDEIYMYSTFVVDELQRICKESSGVGNRQFCDCENFDFDSFSGIIECNYYVEPDGSDICETTINYCGEPVELCYRKTVVLEAADHENYEYTTCFTYLEPYQQHACITFNSTGENSFPYEIETIEDTMAVNQSSSSCSVEFNNMRCNSCSTEVKTDEGYQERCLQIDCSNTGDENNIIDTCNGRSFPTTLRENMIFGDDCTRCQPCGLGHSIQNRDAEGYFPVIGEYQCSGMELAAKIGFFDRNLCPEVQTKTAEYCGCEPKFYDPTLISNPIKKAPRNEMVSSSFANLYEATILLPGDTIGDKACDVCGTKKAIVANPNNIVTLPNGVRTSCSALQGAGVLGMFTSAYCRREVMPLVFRTCGGCYNEQEESQPIIDTSSSVAESPVIEEDLATTTSNIDGDVAEGQGTPSDPEDVAIWIAANQVYDESDRKYNPGPFSSVAESPVVEDDPATTTTNIDWNVGKRQSTPSDLDDAAIRIAANPVHEESDRESNPTTQLHREEPQEIDVLTNKDDGNESIISQTDEEDFREFETFSRTEESAGIEYNPTEDNANSAIESRINGEETKNNFHKEEPEEIDVEFNAADFGSINKPLPSEASSEVSSDSSSLSLTRVSGISTTIVAICTFAVYFS